MRIGSKEGILLPIALILILALSAAALAALILARTESLSERGDHRHLRLRASEAELLAAPLDADGWTQTAMEGLSVVPLASGYHLLRVTRGHGAPGASAVYWALDPDSVAQNLLPGALEIAGVMHPERGVRAMTPEEGCPPPYGKLLTRGPRVPAFPAPDPLLPPLPRLGPLGIEALIEVASIHLADEGNFPDAAVPGAGLIRAPPGAHVTGGTGGGLLLAEGDLRIAGDSGFRGMVMVGGDLVMAESATIEGIALVAGAVSLTGESGILGCPGFARIVLNHPRLTRLFPISGGELLGRF